MALNAAMALAPQWVDAVEKRLRTSSNSAVGLPYDCRLVHAIDAALPIWRLNPMSDWTEILRQLSWRANAFQKSTSAASREREVAAQAADKCAYPLIELF